MTYPGSHFHRTRIALKREEDGTWSASSPDIPELKVSLPVNLTGANHLVHEAIRELQPSRHYTELYYFPSESCR